jgi:hypothetical protein
LGGSGSASGSAYIQGGLGASASAGVSYTPASGLEFPTTFETNFVTPSYGSDASFHFESLSLDMSVTGTENFVLSWSGLLEVNFDVSLTAGTSYVAGTVASSRFRVIVNPNSTLPAASSATATRQIRGSVGGPAAAEVESDRPQSDNRAPKALVPGNEVEFTFFYEDFEPNELTVLLFSLTNGVNIIPLLEERFITSTSRSGELTARWVVPADTAFLAHLDAYSSETDFVDVWAVETSVSNIPSKKIVSAEKFSLLSVRGNTTSTTPAGFFRGMGTKNRLRSVHLSELDEPDNVCTDATSPGLLGFKVDLGAAIPSYDVLSMNQAVGLSTGSNVYTGQSCVAGVIDVTGPPTQNPTVVPTSTRPTTVPTVTKPTVVNRPSVAPTSTMPTAVRTSTRPTAVPTTYEPTASPTENDFIMFEAQQVLL